MPIVDYLPNERIPCVQLNSPGIRKIYDPTPTAAGLHLLSSIVNDWPDRVSIAILRRCAETEFPSGRIAVIGGVSPDDAPAGHTVATGLLGEKNRALAEFRELAIQANLDVRATGCQPSGRFIVECHPVS